MRTRRTPLTILLAAALAGVAALPAAAQGVELGRTSLPAAGVQAWVPVKVAQFGRYRFGAEAKGAVELALVDRSSGALASGSGSLELFLDAGEYRLRVAKPEGVACSLRAEAFAVANAGPDWRGAPALPAEGFSGQLRPGEIAGWWVEVQAGKPFELEAAGRCLAGVAFWRDGLWQTPCRLESGAVQFQPGRPLRVVAGAGDLAPGRYLVTCWGGPALAWGDDAKANPLSLRADPPRLGAFSYAERRVGASGIDEFRIPDSVEAVRLESADAPRLSVWRSAGFRRAEIGASAAAGGRIIDLRRGAGSGSLLTVAGAPGTAYRLWLAPRIENGGSVVFSKGAYEGARLVTVARFGPDADPGLSYLSNQTRAGGLPDGMDSVYEVSAAQSLRFRGNNLQENRFLFRLARDTELRFVEKSPDVSAGYAIQPLAAWLGSSRRDRVDLVAGKNFSLAAGVYMLQTNPLKRGVIEFELRTTGLLDRPKAAPLGVPGCSSVSAAKEPFSMIMANPSRGDLAVQTIALPARLAEPVGLYLGGGQRVELPVEPREDGRLRVGGAGVRCLVDGAACAPDAPVPAGRHLVTLELPAGAGAWVGLEWLPPVSDFRAPAQPAVDPETVAVPAGRTAWEDIGRGQVKRYRMDLAKPGLYRLETDGRVYCAMAVRSRLDADLFKVQPGELPGTRLDAYLDAGSYLVELGECGGGAGAVGLSAVKLAVQEAPPLAPGRTLRLSVPADTVLAVPVELPRAGDCRVASLSPGREFRTRLEDADGFPLAADSASGGFDLPAAAGRYRLVAYPCDYATRRQVGLAPPAAADAAASALVPNRVVAGEWEQGPDDLVYRGELAAPVHCQLALSPGMRYRLLAGGELADAGVGDPRRGGPVLELPAGPIELRLRSAEDDNRKSFSFCLAVAEMTAGESRGYAGADQSLPVSIGAAGDYEFWSSGVIEAEARLIDAEGRTVAVSQPIADDWNFSLVARLAPGAYTLATGALDRGGAAPRQTARRVEETGGEEGGRAEEAGGYERGEAEGGEDGDGGDRETEADYAGGDGGDGEGRDGGGAGTAADAGAGVASPVAADGPFVVRLDRRMESPARLEGDSPQRGAFDLGTEIRTVDFKVGATGAYRIACAASAQVLVELSGPRGRIAVAAGGMDAVLRGKADYRLRLWKIGDETVPAALTVEALGPDRAVQAAAPPRRVVALGGARLASAGIDRPFVALEPGQGLAAAEGGVWAEREAGADAPAAATPNLEPDGALRCLQSAEALECGLRVPAGRVALVAAAARGGATGLSLAKGDAQPGFSWEGVGIGADGSERIAGPGYWRLAAWSVAPASGAAPAVDLSSVSFPLLETLRADGAPAQRELPPGGAVAVEAVAGGTVRLRLEQGLVAAANGPGGAFLDARGAAAEGGLGGGPVYVVNTDTVVHRLSLNAGPAAPAGLSAATDWERPADENQVVETPVQGQPGKAILLSGHVRAAWLLSAADGLRRDARPAGGRWSLPAQTGRLFVESDGGPVHAWIDGGNPDQGEFGPLNPSPAPLALGAVAPALAPAQAWRVRLDAPGLVVVQSGGAGVTAWCAPNGEARRSLAADGPAAMVVAADKGEALVKARPFAGQAPAGWVRVSAVAAEDLPADGVGPARLIGAGQVQLWRFTLAAAARVGVGVKSERENLRVGLLGADGRPLDRGGLFIRRLEAGTYYLLVESDAGPCTYRPFAYGLAGDRIDLPEDAASAYSAPAVNEEGEE